MICEKCGKEYFYTQNRKKKSIFCAKCRQIINQEKHYLNNKEVYKNRARQRKIEKRDEVRIKNKEYREKHKEKFDLYFKEYGIINKEKLSEKHKKYYLQNQKIIKERVKLYRKTFRGKETKLKERLKHRDYYLKYYKDYNKSLIGKEKDKIKYNKRKRNLGFIPLNEYFIDSHAHHIDDKNIIYIPKETHKLIWHRQKSIYTMDRINTYAYFFLIQQNIKELGLLFKNDC